MILITRLGQGRSSNAQLPAVKMWACSPVLQVYFKKILWTLPLPEMRQDYEQQFTFPGHLEERSRCLDLFLKLYGDPCPLRQVRHGYLCLCLCVCLCLSTCNISGPVPSRSSSLQGQPSCFNEKVQWHGESVISWVVNKSGAEEVHLVQQYSIYWSSDCAI